MCTITAKQEGARIEPRRFRIDPEVPIELTVGALKKLVECVFRPSYHR